jgi:subtilisin family serine protease
MKRFTPVSTVGYVLAGSLALGACSDDAGAPTGPSAAAPSLSQSAAAGSSLVLFRGSAIPAGFAEQVEALGGTVAYSHAGVGFAMVEGLGEGAVAQIRGLNGVADVQPDAEFSLGVPQAAVENEMGADASDAMMSQANPTTASRYVWQWNMRSIGAHKAWAAGKLGSPDVTVAILDSGIDYDAPDLRGLVDLSRSRSFVPSDNAINRRPVPHAPPDLGLQRARHQRRHAGEQQGHRPGRRDLQDHADQRQGAGRQRFGSLGGVLSGIIHAATRARTWPT